MKLIIILFLLSTLSSCKTIKMNRESEKSIQISIYDLKNLSPNECLDVQNLFIFDTQKVIISPHAINDNIIERQEKYIEGLSNVSKFKNLKHLYFLNICMKDLPDVILSLEKLEELQFNFIDEFVIEKQVSKLIQFKKLKILMLNQHFIGDEKFNLIKTRLAKSKIKVISS